MKIEVNIEKSGDGYNVELNAPEKTTIGDGLALICHALYWLTRNLVERDGMSQEEAEKKIIDLARELLEDNREGKGVQA